MYTSMKKIKLIYNPSSGDASFKNKLDSVIGRMQKAGYTVVPYRSSNANSLHRAFEDIDDSYRSVAVSGGDGTISTVVNFMAGQGIDLPVGIFPFGTANDFASHLGIPRDPEACCDIITGGEIKNMDIGRANDRYFINVCSAGLLSEVAYKTDTNLKNAIGKIAYYVKGLEEVPKFSPIKMRMQYGDNVIEDNFLMFLVLNGSSAGGFNKLAPGALMDDGYMDVLAVKWSNITNMFALFLKALRGEHVGDASLYHFKADKLVISCMRQCETDIDGEKGPDFPLEIEVLKNYLKVFVPKRT